MFLPAFFTFRGRLRRRPAQTLIEFDICTANDAAILTFDHPPLTHQGGSVPYMLMRKVDWTCVLIASSLTIESVKLNLPFVLHRLFLLYFVDTVDIVFDIA